MFAAKAIRKGKTVSPNLSLVPKTHDLSIVPASHDDCNVVCRMFGELHRYNASLDSYFALSDDWEALLRNEFTHTYKDPDRLWLLVKDGATAVGLLMTAVHTDSPLFRHRQWVEVQALYVANSHRRMGIARHLLDCAYAWATARDLPRVQLYVTASNVRAKSVYEDEGFAVTQCIMRKQL